MTVIITGMIIVLIGSLRWRVHNSDGNSKGKWMNLIINLTLRPRLGQNLTQVIVPIKADLSEIL